MNLHLGCGKRRLAGWINIDARPDVGADLVADIGNLDSFEDGAAGIIYACHVLEHIPRPQVPGVLAEWRRVLRTRGLLRLAVPDFAAAAKLYERHVPMQRLAGLLHGRQDAAWNVHYAVYDWHLLAQLLTEAGFYNLQRWEPWVVHPEGYDDYSFAEIDGVPVSLNVEARRGG